MARKPIIRTAVLETLEKFTEGLTFSELISKIEEVLGRSVHDAVLNYALKSLITDGAIEKFIPRGVYLKLLERECDVVKDSIRKDRASKN